MAAEVCWKSSRSQGWLQKSVRSLPGPQDGCRSLLEVFQCYRVPRYPEVFDEGVVLFQVAMMAAEVCVKSLALL